MEQHVKLSLCTARYENTGDFESLNGQLTIQEGKQYLCAYLDDETFMIYEDGMFYSANSIDFDF
jgi:hypothetical protein